MKQNDLLKLENIVGKKNVKSDPADLYIYGSDSSVHSALPWAVVRPENTKHVQKIVKYEKTKKICNRFDRGNDVCK